MDFINTLARNGMLDNVYIILQASESQHFFFSKFTYIYYHNLHLLVIIEKKRRCKKAELFPKREEDI